VRLHRNLGLELRTVIDLGKYVTFLRVINFFLVECKLLFVFQKFVKLGATVLPSPRALLTSYVKFLSISEAEIPTEEPDEGPVE
jgi:hypothetical protein